MNFARDVANEVAYLDKGVLIEKGSPERIFTSPREESTKNSSVAFARAVSASRELSARQDRTGRG